MLARRESLPSPAELIGTDDSEDRNGVKARHELKRSWLELTLDSRPGTKVSDTLLRAASEAWGGHQSADGKLSPRTALKELVHSLQMARLSK